MRFDWRCNSRDADVTHYYYAGAGSGPGSLPTYKMLQFPAEGAGASQCILRQQAIRAGLDQAENRRVASRARTFARARRLLPDRLLR